MKKLTAMLLMIVLTFGAISLTGCGSSESSSESSDDHAKIGVSLQDSSITFYTDICDTVQKTTDEKGDEFIVTDAGGDLQKQIDQVNDLISQDIDVLLICPKDKAGIEPALKACKDADIPVISFDLKPDDMEDVVSHVASDNKACGEVIGARIAEDMEDGSKILVITGSVYESITSRVEGMYEATKAANKNYDFVEVDWTGSEDITKIVEDALQANPDLDAIYGPYELYSLTAAAAVESAGMGIPVYGVDASPSEKAAIKEGKIKATAAQSPYKIGEQLAEVIYKVLAGEEVEKEYLIPSFVVDGENVDEYGTDSWQ